MSLLLAASSGGAYSLTCASGTYTYTGKAASLTAAFKLTAAAGAYTYTGKAATASRGYALTAAPGAYAYTGVAATLTYAAGTAVYTLSCAPGAYAYAGLPATLTYASTAQAPTKVGGDDVPERVEIWTIRKAKKAAKRVAKRIEVLAEEAEQPIALPTQPETDTPDWVVYLEALQALELTLLSQWAAMIDEEDEELMLLL